MQLAFLIAVFVIFTCLGIIALFLYGAIKRKHREIEEALTPAPAEESIPGTPVNFGHKCMWFSIRTSNPRRLSELFEMEDATECNWQHGIDMAYENRFYITPPVEGWSMVFKLFEVKGDDEESITRLKNILIVLSREFGEAQFFCSSPVTDFCCWMRARHGTVLRVYAYNGLLSENIAIEGEPDSFEASLKLPDTFSAEAEDEDYSERRDIHFPDEQTLMRIAGHWSINPSELESKKQLEPALGLLGVIPGGLI